MGRAARRRMHAPRPPLPQRDGLDAISVSAPGSGLAVEVLSHRLPALLSPAATDLTLRFARGEIVRTDGSPFAAQDPVEAGERIWLHRELAPEVVPDVPLPILLQDEHLLVLDKPHDMATMPRGAHILSSALVRLRRRTGITTLSPLHRLDRRTAGVLLFGIRPEERSAYQRLFARGEVRKEYLARVHSPADPPSPGTSWTLRDRLERRPGQLQTAVLPGPENAITEVEVIDREQGFLDLRLRPLTGRTHQLRAQLSHAGMPILGDDLYPRVRELDEQDPPLALLAHRLELQDPITGERRELISSRHVP